MIVVSRGGGGGGRGGTKGNPLQSLRTRGFRKGISRYKFTDIAQKKMCGGGVEAKLYKALSSQERARGFIWAALFPGVLKINARSFKITLQVFMRQRPDHRLPPTSSALWTNDTLGLIELAQLLDIFPLWAEGCNHSIQLGPLLMLECLCWS